MWVMGSVPVSAFSSPWSRYAQISLKAGRAGSPCMVSIAQPLQAPRTSRDAAREKTGRTMARRTVWLLSRDYSPRGTPAQPAPLRAVKERRDVCRKICRGRVNVQDDPEPALCVDEPEGRSVGYLVAAAEGVDEASGGGQV